METEAEVVEPSPLPILAVDIGNSATKLALFEVRSLETRFVLPEPTWVEHLSTFSNPGAKLAEKLPPQARWRVASVHRDAQRRLQRWVTENRPVDSYVNFTFSDLPIDVKVDHPEKVGLDRLVAAVGANLLRDSMRPAVVIDAGTALKVDLVSVSGAFEGGVILPGFHMTARALAGGTDALPEVLLEPTADPPPVLGKSTEAAIRSGLFWGAVGAVREIVARYAEKYGPPQVFVTGGDLQRLAPLVGSNARFIPNLVLAGIAVSARNT